MFSIRNKTTEEPQEQFNDTCPMLLFTHGGNRGASAKLSQEKVKNIEESSKGMAKNERTITSHNHFIRQRSPSPRQLETSCSIDYQG